MKSLKYILIHTLFLIPAIIADAQIFQLDTLQSFITGESNATAYCSGCNGPAPCPSDTEHNVMTGYYLAESSPVRTWIAGTYARAYFKPFIPWLGHCLDEAAGISTAYIIGENSSSLKMIFGVQAVAKHLCPERQCPDQNYDNEAWEVDAGLPPVSDFGASCSTQLFFEVSGLPAGQSVSVSFRAKLFAFNINRPEPNDTEMDDVNLSADAFSLWLNGAPILNQIFINGTTVSGNFQVQNGDEIRVDFSGYASAEVHDEPAPNGFLGGFYEKDIAQAGVRAELYLNAEPSEVASLKVSVDIGSDHEISDPSPDGNEFLDPGDIYNLVDSSANQPPLFYNDADIMGVDIAPVEGDPATAAPVCIGLPPSDSLRSQYFNMNGLAMIDYQLQTDIPAYPGSSGPCVFAMDECSPVLVSYDDDSPLAWYSEGFSCMGVIPVTLGQGSLGQDQNRDEVSYFYPFRISPLNFATPFPVPLGSESELHPALSPSPDSTGSQFNDDIDAMDAAFCEACSTIYFSVSHEAPGVANGQLLNPGIIYQVIPGGNPEPVIYPSKNLGLPDTIGVDLDAFDFCWLEDTSGQIKFAILFSVSADDFETAVNESGLLDPHTIYYSFLDGTYGELENMVFEYDIDGLSVANGLPALLDSCNKMSTGIFSPSSQTRFSVYPNPVNDQPFTIELPFQSLSEKIQVKLIDLQGRTVLKKHFSPKEKLRINTSELEPGWYIIVVENGIHPPGYQRIYLK